MKCLYYIKENKNRIFMNAIFEHKENTMQWIKNILAGFFFKKILQLKIY